MGGEFKGKSGYVEVRYGDEVVYSGYYLNGRLFVVDAPALNRIWYKGLLSEVEYENERMGNPMRYAYEKYGDRYIKHFEKFTREVLEEVEKTFQREDLDITMISMPEEHVREILGLPADLTFENGEDITSESLEIKSLSLESLEGHLKALRYREYYINGRGNGDLIPYLNMSENRKRGRSSFLLIYPRRIVLVGNLHGLEFVALAPGIKVAIETLRWISKQTGFGEADTDENRLTISRFVEVGVPLSKVLPEGEDRFRVRIFRHIGNFVSVDNEVLMAGKDLNTKYGEYVEWVKRVMNEVRFTPPPTMTKPAWSKLVEAYLEDFPHPLDFKRMINVDLLGEVNIPECKAINRLYALSTSSGGS